MLGGGAGFQTQSQRQNPPNLLQQGALLGSSSLGSLRLRRSDPEERRTRGSRTDLRWTVTVSMPLKRELELHLPLAAVLGPPSAL